MSCGDRRRDQLPAFYTHFGIFPYFDSCGVEVKNCCKMMKKYEKNYFLGLIMGRKKANISFKTAPFLISTVAVPPIRFVGFSALNTGSD